MPTGRNIRPPRRFADDTDLYDSASQKQPRGPRCAIPAFPEKAQIIEYDPNLPVAAFPSLDWLEQNGLPQSTPSQRRAIPAESFNGFEASTVTSSLTETPIESQLGNHAHKANALNGGRGPSDLEDDNPPKDVIRATEANGTEKELLGLASQEMDTSDEEESGQEPIRWADLSPAMQGRICANLAVIRKEPVDLVIERLFLNPGEARRALQHHSERQRQEAKEHTISMQIVQDQLHALLRRDASSGPQREYEQHRQIFNRHFQAHNSLLDHGHLMFSLQDLSRAEKYLSRRQLDISIAHQDLGSIPTFDESSPGRDRIMPAAQNLLMAQTLAQGSAASAAPVSAASDTQPTRGSQSPGYQALSQRLDRLKLSKRPITPAQKVVATPKIGNSSTSTTSASSLADTSSVEGERSTSRRKGLRSSRERKLTEKAREAIESGMSVPGGSAMNIFQERQNEEDEDCVTEDVCPRVESERPSNATRNPSEKLSDPLANLRIKLKFNDGGEGLLRRHDMREERAQDEIRKIRRDGSEFRQEKNRDSPKQSPVPRQVISRQTSPTDVQFTQMTQKELQRAAVAIQGEDRQKNIQRLVDSQADQPGEPGRHGSVDISIPPPYSPISPQSFCVSHKDGLAERGTNPTTTSSSGNQASEALLPSSSPDLQNCPTLPSRQSSSGQRRDLSRALSKPKHNLLQNPNYQATESTLLASANRENEYYERFTFPFVGIADAQTAPGHDKSCDERNNIQDEREFTSRLPVTKSQELLPKLSDSEGVGSQPRSRLDASKQIQRPNSEPPRASLGSKFSSSHNGVEEASKLYSKVSKSATTGKSLSNGPENSGMGSKANDTSAEQPKMSTPTPQDQTSLDENVDNLKVSIENERSAKQEVPTSTPSSKKQTMSGSGESSNIGGWQPESVEMARKAGFLVNDISDEPFRESRASAAGFTTSPLHVARAPAPTQNINPTRKKQQVSSETGELIDGLNEKINDINTSRNCKPRHVQQNFGDTAQSQNTTVAQPSSSKEETLADAQSVEKKTLSSVFSPDFTPKSASTQNKGLKRNATARKRSRSKLGPSSPGTSPRRKVAAVSKGTSNRGKPVPVSVQSKASTSKTDSTSSSTSRLKAQNPSHKRAGSNTSFNSAVDVPSSGEGLGSSPAIVEQHMPEMENRSPKKPERTKKKLRLSDQKDQISSPLENLTANRSTTSPAKTNPDSEEKVASDTAITPSTSSLNGPLDAMTLHSVSSPVSNDLPSSPLQHKTARRAPSIEVKKQIETGSADKSIAASTKQTPKDAKPDDKRKLLPPAPLRRKKTAREAELESRDSGLSDSPGANRTRRRTATPSTGIAEAMEKKTITKAEEEVQEPDLGNSPVASRTRRRTTTPNVAMTMTETKEKKKAGRDKPDSRQDPVPQPDSPVANRTRRRTATPSTIVLETKKKKKDQRRKAERKEAVAAVPSKQGQVKEKGKTSLPPRRSGRLTDRVEID